MTVIIDAELYRMTTDAILVLLQLLPLLFFVFSDTTDVLFKQRFMVVLLLLH